MTIFAIVLKEANEQLYERLDEQYPENFQFNDTFAAVSSDEFERECC